jgi:hypothetical protein
MRPFGIVEPDEALNGALSMPKRPATLQREAFIIDRPKEPLDLAVGLWPTRTKQMVHDAHAATGLFEARQAVAVERVAHRECHGVIGQDGLDAVGQRGDGLLEELRRRSAALSGLSRPRPLRD